MKKHLLVVLGLMLGLVHSAVSQEVSVLIEPLTQNFPSQVASYLDNPFRYARVRVINNTAVQQQVYLTLQMTAQLSGGNDQFAIFSQDHGTSRPKITLQPGGIYVLDSREAFIDHFSGRLQLSMPQGGLADYVQVPEGTYRLCVQACRWTEVVSNDQPLAEACLPMNICYTGSAPEFTSPVMAGMGNSATLQPQRNINVRWSEVITNCATNARFRYVLKIVKVLPGQNILQAIDRNPVFFSEDCGSNTYCVIDTLRDLRIPLEAGATYAMKVTAVQRNAGAGVQITLGNGGASQVVSFTWGEARYNAGPQNEPSPGPEAPSQQNQNVEESDSDNQAAVKGKIKMPQFTAPRKANASLLVEPGKFAAKWTSVQGDSVKAAIYVVELYEDNLGGIDPSTVHAPLATATVNGPLGHLYGGEKPDTVAVADRGWDTLLAVGAKYLIKLRTHAAYTYHSAHHRRTTHYVNGIAADVEEDSLCTLHDAFLDDEAELKFQWGIDSSALIPASPAQFTYPVNHATHDWNDTACGEFGLECPEVQRFDDFELMWNKPKDIEIGDSVQYTIYIYEMAKGKKLKEILAGKPKFTIEKQLGTTYNDTILDSLETGKSYVVRLRTQAIDETNPKYNFFGDGYSHAMYFKLVDTVDYSELIDTKFACFPKDTTGLDRVPVKVDVDKLIHNRTRLKLGRFDLIVQEATDKPQAINGKGDKKGNKQGGDKKDVDKKDGDKKDGDKKDGDKKDGDKKDGDKKDGKKDDKKDDKKKAEEYSVISGEGYVLWHPLGFGCGIKVKFDTIKVNKNNQVISGSARTIPTDSNNYINLNIGNNKFGSGFDMLSDGAATVLDKVSGKLGSTGEDVKKWYN